MATGHVKWWNDEKGFGFLTSDEGTDVFVHFSEVQSEESPMLTDSHAVEFEITEGKRGPVAKNVRNPGDPITVPPAQVPKPSPSTQGRSESRSSLSSSVNLWQLEECIGCEIVAVDVVDKVLDEIIRLESGDRFRVSDHSIPLVDEFDEVLVLRDRVAHMYRIVTPYEVLEVHRLRANT